MAAPTVLYVEDEEADVLFMRWAFTQAGLAREMLQVAEDGAEAVNYLSGHGPYADRQLHPLPSLILLDLNLPTLSGFEVLEWVKQQPLLKTIPVFIFSSSPRPEDKAMAASLGADAYLEKPGSGLEFGTTVKIVQERLVKLNGTRLRA